MEDRSIPHTDLPGASRLFSDFLCDFDKVRDFYAFSPRESASYASAAAALQYPLERRAALVDALREQNGESPSSSLCWRVPVRVLSRPASRWACSRDPPTRSTRR